MTSTAPFDIGSLISATPEVYGGRPCLAGTRFPVSLVAAYSRRGPSGLAQLLAEFPALDEAKVHAAVAYYLANKASFDAEFDEDAVAVEDLKAKGW